MLWPFLQAGVARIGAYDVFIAMQQLSDFRHVSHICGSAVDVMHQTRLRIGADMRFHAKR
ncbi:hypothetical protein D3C79_1017620 [compost metagenome]